jgi:murein tripeptide amidase MpaA
MRWFLAGRDGARRRANRVRYIMANDLLTLAEKSEFRQTGRSDEVERLCATFSAHWPDAVRMFSYGRSSEGRPMLALLVTRAGHIDPAGLRAAGVPLLFLQAGIHPGESDGKDAGFIALRELLQGEAAAEALNKIAILFVPAFNVDGHERMDTGIAPIKTARKRPAGASPRVTSISIGTTAKPTRRKCARCCASSRSGIR